MVPIQHAARTRRAALVLVLAIATPMATPGAQAAHLIHRVIRVRSVTTARHTTDRPPKGRSRGDTLVVHDRLLDTARQFGRPSRVMVGSDVATYRLTSTTTFTMKGVATLPGGTLRISSLGNATGSTQHPLTVTGGTGIYADAHGTMTIGGDSVNTYRIVIPAG